jgi:hypothetical protein
MIIVDGSIASVIIFSNMRENLKFVGLMMMFIVSAFTVIVGALDIVKEYDSYKHEKTWCRKSCDET